MPADNERIDATAAVVRLRSLTAAETAIRIWHFDFAQYKQFVPRRKFRGSRHRVMCNTA